MTDYSEISPLDGLVDHSSLVQRRKQRRKQHTYVLFFSSWWRNCSHLEIIWRSPKRQRPRGPRLLSIVSILEGQDSWPGAQCLAWGRAQSRECVWAAQEPVGHPTGLVSVTVSREMKARISAEGGFAQSTAGRETCHVLSSVIRISCLNTWYFKSLESKVRNPNTIRLSHSYESSQVPLGTVTLANASFWSSSKFVLLITQILDVFHLVEKSVLFPLETLYPQTARNFSEDYILVWTSLVLLATSLSW